MNSDNVLAFPGFQRCKKTEINKTKMTKFGVAFQLGVCQPEGIYVAWSEGRCHARLRNADNETHASRKGVSRKRGFVSPDTTLPSTLVFSSCFSQTGSELTETFLGHFWLYSETRTVMYVRQNMGVAHSMTSG
eukprot:6458786-Amphidinium_carterae.2